MYFQPSKHVKGILAKACTLLSDTVNPVSEYFVTRSKSLDESDCTRQENESGEERAENDPSSLTSKTHYNLPYESLNLVV